MKTILFLLIFIFSATSVISNDVIKVAVNSTPPYRIIQNNTYSGIYIDVIILVGKDLGVELEFIEVPFKRALQLLKTGSADMMLGPNLLDEREQYMFYLKETPLPSVNKAFYFKNPEKVISRYEDLYSLKIGVLRGATYFKQFDSDSNIDKIEVVDYDTGLKMLNFNRLDCLIMPEVSADYLIKTRNLTIIKSPLIIQGNSSYITISKKSRWIEKSDKIESSLKRVISTTSIQELMNLYIY